MCNVKDDPCQDTSCNPVHMRELTARGPIKTLCAELRMTDEHLAKYQANLLEAINKGLKKATNAEASVKCFPTYVQTLPDGTEKGKYLALDLGGSNFRVLLVDIGNKMYKQEHETFVVPPEVMTGTGTQLFDFLATCIESFTKSRGINDQNLPLGFTFSFPVQQKGLKVGICERWTKGFTCSGVVGNDVVKLLEEAIGRRGNLKVNVAAVINDTTGTLLSAAFFDHDTKVGLIVATGTNGCYVEKQCNAELFDEPDVGTGVVIVNTESGAFGDNGELDYIRTEYDRIVDENTVNAGRQLHEKMISGMYLGELVRLMCIKAACKGVLFGGKISEKFGTPLSFDTRFVSEIETDPPCSYDNVKRILKELELTGLHEEDYQDVRYICAAFSQRAAFLVASFNVTVIKKMEYKTVTIGIDGSLYIHHPHFKHLVALKMDELLKGTPYTYKLRLAQDGSGVGAALAAAVASKTASKSC